jgi:hypothetical protein
MMHPSRAGPVRQGRRDRMLSGVDGAAVTLWAVAGNDG